MEGARGGRFAVAASSLPVVSGFACYIYYRVDAACAAELEPRVRAMQADVQRLTGIAGRLMKKRGEPLLWMEVYEGIDDAPHFESTLARLVESYGLSTGLQPGTARKTETFLA